MSGTSIWSRARRSSSRLDRARRPRVPARSALLWSRSKLSTNRCDLVPEPGQHQLGVVPLHPQQLIAIRLKFGCQLKRSTASQGPSSRARPAPGQEVVARSAFHRGVRMLTSARGASTGGGPVTARRARTPSRRRRPSRDGRCTTPGRGAPAADVVGGPWRHRTSGSSSGHRPRTADPRTGERPASEAGSSRNSLCQGSRRRRDGSTARSFDGRAGRGASPRAVRLEESCHRRRQPGRGARPWVRRRPIRQRRFRERRNAGVPGRCITRSV